jgi:hypothetical protein
VGSAAPNPGTSKSHSDSSNGELAHGVLFYVARSRVSWQCSRLVLAIGALLRSIVTSILPPWAIGHEYGLWRNVATMGASFVHDTIISIVVAQRERVRLTALLNCLACEPLVTWAKATIHQTVPKRAVTMGRLPPMWVFNVPLKRSGVALRNTSAWAGKSGVRGVRGASTGIMCVLSLSPICGSRTFPQGRGVKLDSDYSGSAPWSKFFALFSSL